MIKRLFFISILALFLCMNQNTYAQNYAKKYGIAVLGGINEHIGDRGSAFFIARKPIYWGVTGNFGYYLNSSFDAIVLGEVGDLGFYDRWNDGFNARYYNYMAGLRFKLANGSILSEQSKLRPFLQAGFGGFQFRTKIRDQFESPTYHSHKGLSLQWAAGGGVKYELTPSLDLVAQMMYNYTYDDNIDGTPFSMGRHRLNKLHDAYVTSKLGLAYNFGVNDNYKITTKDNEVPKEVIDKLNLFSKQIQFETAKSIIKPESFASLDSIVTLMKVYPNVNALVEGHTDDVGDDEDNRILSQERADAVMKYLLSKGLDETRLTANGYGETQPIATNKTPEGRAQNRRCVVKPYIKK